MCPFRPALNISSVINIGLQPTESLPQVAMHRLESANQRPKEGDGDAMMRRNQQYTVLHNDKVD